MILFLVFYSNQGLVSTGAKLKGCNRDKKIGTDGYSFLFLIAGAINFGTKIFQIIWQFQILWKNSRTFVS
jgi:hypothetical protein